MDTTNPETSGGPQPPSRPATADLATWPREALLAEVERLRNKVDELAREHLSKNATIRLVADAVEERLKPRREHVEQLVLEGYLAGWNARADCEREDLGPPSFAGVMNPAQAAVDKITMKT